MHLLIISIPKITLPQQIHTRNMIRCQSHQFIRKKYRILIIMHIQIIYRQLVQSTQHLITQHLSRKRIQLLEMVLGMRTIVGLEQLGQEEDAVGTRRSEDGRFTSTHLN